MPTLDTNSLGATSTVYDVRNSGNVNVFIDGATGTHEHHRVMVETSVDGTTWFEENEHLSGKGYLHVSVMAQQVRLKVGKAEGATSTINYWFFGVEDEHSYTWSDEYSASNGDEVMFFENTSSTKKFYVNWIRCGCDHDSLLVLKKATGTPTGGVTVDSVNLNHSSSETPDALVERDVTGGLTLGDSIDYMRLAADTSGLMDFKGMLVLDEDDIITLTVEVPIPSDTNWTICGTYK